MRKCKCKFLDKEAKQKISTEGLFHQWAATYDEFENGPGNLTVALVEISGGRIVLSEPTDIKFLE